MLLLLGEVDVFLHDLVLPLLFLVQLLLHDGCLLQLELFAGLLLALFLLLGSLDRVLDCIPLDVFLLLLLSVHLLLDLLHGCGKLGGRVFLILLLLERLGLRIELVLGVDVLRGCVDDALAFVGSGRVHRNCDIEIGLLALLIFNSIHNLLHLGLGLGVDCHVVYSSCLLCVVLWWLTWFRAGSDVALLRVLALAYLSYC